MKFYFSNPSFYGEAGGQAYHEALTLWQMLRPMIGTVLIGLLIVVGIVALLFYCFTASSLHTMLQRRGLGGAFTAWIPVVRWYALGRVADDASTLSGRKSCFSALLLLTSLLPPIGSVLPGILLGRVGFAWLSCGIALLFLLIRQIVLLLALSEIYRDYAPSGWIPMLVFSAVLPLLYPIFLLSIHNKIPDSARRTWTPPETQQAPPRPSNPTPPESPAPPMSESPMA